MTSPHPVLSDPPVPSPTMPHPPGNDTLNFPWLSNEFDFSWSSATDSNELASLKLHALGSTPNYGVGVLWKPNENYEFKQSPFDISDCDLLAGNFFKSIVGSGFPPPYDSPSSSSSSSSSSPPPSFSSTPTTGYSSPELRPFYDYYPRSYHRCIDLPPADPPTICVDPNETWGTNPDPNIILSPSTFPASTPEQHIPPSPLQMSDVHADLPVISGNNPKRPWTSNSEYSGLLSFDGLAALSPSMDKHHPPPSPSELSDLDHYSTSTSDASSDGDSVFTFTPPSAPSTSRHAAAMGSPIWIRRSSRKSNRPQSYRDHDPDPLDNEGSLAQPVTPSRGSPKRKKAPVDDVYVDIPEVSSSSSSSSSRGRSKKSKGKRGPKEEKFPCPAGCPKAFSRSHDAERHFTSCHKGEGAVCMYCHKCLSRFDALTRHWDSCKSMPKDL